MTQGLESGTEPATTAGATPRPEGDEVFGHAATSGEASPTTLTNVSQNGNPSASPSQEEGHRVVGSVADAKPEEGEGKRKRKSKGYKKSDVIVRCVKFQIDFKRAEELRSEEETEKLTVKKACFEAQKGCCRAANAIARKLWEIDGKYVDDFYLEHGRFPTRKGDAWPIPEGNFYALARKMAPELNAGIAADLSHAVFSKWKKERFQILTQWSRSVPAFRDKNPIPIRRQDYRIEKGEKKNEYLVCLSLAAGRHPGGKQFRIPFYLKDRYQRDAMEKIMSGEWVLGAAKVEKNHRGQWFVSFSYQMPKGVSNGVRCAAINRGIKNFLVGVTEDGVKWMYDGGDIEAFLKQVQSRRKGYQYNSKASGRLGRGRKRVLLPTKVLENMVNGYRRTKNQWIALNFVKYLVKHGIGKIYIEDFSGIRDGEPEKLVGGKAVWDRIQEWPYYALMQCIISKLEEFGIEYEMKKWVLHCVSCERYVNLDVGAAMNVLARGKGEWSVDDYDEELKKQGFKKGKKSKKSNRSKKSK